MKQFFAEHRFAVATTSCEAPEAYIAEPNTLRHTLHHLLCYCKKDWRQCETDGVRESLVRIEDPDEWTMDQEGVPYLWQMDLEDGHIHVYRLTEEGGA